MTIEWYDQIAKQLGGYVQNWTHEVKGLSGEQVFENTLKQVINPEMYVLDAGCGHGDFTMKWVNQCRQIIGIDNSIEMINIAQQQTLDNSSIRNVQFIHASTKDGLPFNEQTFDIIYSRRGPTSIIQYTHLLKPNGLIIGIHSGSKDKVISQLKASKLQNVQMKDYLATLTFPTTTDFLRFLSRIPGNPDYTHPNNYSQAQELIAAHTKEGKLQIEEYRFIWSGLKMNS